MSYGDYSDDPKRLSFLLHFPRFFVTLLEFAGFLCIKVVWEIEDFEGSCSGKRQSRVRIRDRSISANIKVVGNDEAITDETA